MAKGSYPVDGSSWLWVRLGTLDVLQQPLAAIADRLDHLIGSKLEPVARRSPLRSRWSNHWSRLILTPQPAVRFGSAVGDRDFGSATHNGP